MPLLLRHLAAALLPLASTTAGIVAVGIAVQMPTGPAAPISVPAAVAPLGSMAPVVARVATVPGNGPAPSAVVRPRPHGDVRPAGAALSPRSTVPVTATDVGAPEVPAQRPRQALPPDEPAPLLPPVTPQPVPEPQPAPEATQPTPPPAPAPSPPPVLPSIAPSPPPSAEPLSGRKRKHHGKSPRPKRPKHDKGIVATLAVEPQLQVGDGHDSTVGTGKDGTKDKGAGAGETGTTASGKGGGSEGKDGDKKDGDRKDGDGKGSGKGGGKPHP